MTDPIKMRPCPFCGSANVDPAGWSMKPSRLSLDITTGPACDDCGGSAKTVDAWNGRGDDLRLLPIATTLAAYALNAAHGARLEAFEMDNLRALAKSIGCGVTDQHLAFAVTRTIIGEVMAERKRQVQVLGYAPSEDDEMKLRDEVLTRVSGRATPETRYQLIEAAALIVAEVELLDRTAGSPAALVERAVEQIQHQPV